LQSNVAVKRLVLLLCRYPVSHISPVTNCADTGTACPAARQMRGFYLSIGAGRFLPNHFQTKHVIKNLALKKATLPRLRRLATNGIPAGIDKCYLSNKIMTLHPRLCLFNGQYLILILCVHKGPPGLRDNMLFLS